MSLKIFLILFGTLFAAGAAVFVGVSKLVDDFKQYGKGPLVHLGLMSICTGSSIFLITYLSENYFNSYILFLLIFLLAGLIHVYIMYKKFWSSKKSTTLLSEFLYTLSVVILISVVFGSMEYFLKDADFMFYPMLLSGFGFFIPTLVHKSFEKAILIPEKIYKRWYYPIHNPLPDPDDEDMRDLIVIGFEMEKNTGDGSRTYFRARAPQRMDLCALFYHFINDYNDSHSETPIELVSDFGRPYAWIFEKKTTWYQARKVFDPETPIFANGIKENTVIICKRYIETNKE
ncbi:MAG: hypothetical protein KA198_01030 [Chitinophagaceae bacterium]|nr:hypothetical protein [Chitinophagaceae bacterium]